MKHKVAELDGVLLDAAVAQAEGHEWKIDRLRGDGPDTGVLLRTAPPGVVSVPLGWLFRPSVDWAAGGPIIERERIEFHGAPAGWYGCQHGAVSQTGRARTYCGGPTLLVAAMRCFVASVFGPEVDLP